MAALGIELSIDQIKVMTTRIDGDELARSFAIIDIELSSLVELNDDSVPFIEVPEVGLTV